MYLIGLNAFHADSSAALLKDGKVIFAIEEERFTRKKHWAGLPIKSIECCLKAENITIKDIDAICIGRDTHAKILKKIKYTLSNFQTVLKLLKHRLSNRNKVRSLKSQIEDYFDYCPKIVFVEHHRAHLASAFFSSPFRESTIVSIDGSGDFSTIMIAKGKKNKIEVLESLDFPVSIGLFYTAFTQFLGFPYYGDEYKLMGLAPYGNPTYLKQLRSVIWTDKKHILKWNKKFFNLKDGVISYESNVPKVDSIFNKKQFKRVFGKGRNRNEEIHQNHKDLAHSVQKRTEELIFEVLARAYKKAGIKNLCLAGGVAQNSVANGKIITNTLFEKLYIPSASHDAGISVGAAQFHFFNSLNNTRIDAIYSAKLGIDFTNNQIKQILDERKLAADFFEDEELFDYLAIAISNKYIIGFFDNRAEFGPRALGSRSILADPRNTQAKKLLNKKIKKRESFRPFAPSILEEHGASYFENYSFTPFMEKVLKIKKDKRDLIPAVTHIDGSGRLQSVRKSLNPRFHGLISAFYKKTGIPLLINTSFNENEPIVNTPDEAINCFLKTKLDILVLGNYLIKK